ncbi:hypothetical protein QBC45DRAFT_293040, partial [Copromyces sp. CBS 386.78]
LLGRILQVNDLASCWLVALSSSMKRNCTLHQALSCFVVDGTIPKWSLGYQDDAIVLIYY